MKLWQVAPFFSLPFGEVCNLKEKRQLCIFSFQIRNLTKSEWKKRGNLSDFHLERNYYLQNWYFSCFGYFGFHRKGCLSETPLFNTSCLDLIPQPILYCYCHLLLIQWNRQVYKRIKQYFINKIEISFKLCHLLKSVKEWVAKSRPWTFSVTRFDYNGA